VCSPSLAPDHTLAGLGETGWSAFANALRANSTLTSLHGPAGAELFFRQLRAETPPTVLNLSNAGLTAVSAIVLAALLANNSTLTSLEVQSNRLGNVGAMALCDVLKSANHALTSLNMRQNQLKPAARQALEELRVGDLSVLV
jgi:Ran GTPase-activating protein (RanGAP) involved in mRNA processing and transport